MAITMKEIIEKHGDRMGLTPITAITSLDRLREGKVKSFSEQFNIFREYNATEDKKKLLVEAIGTGDFPEFVNRQVQLTVFKNFESAPSMWEQYAEVKDSNIEVEQYFEMNSTGTFEEVSAERANAPEVEFKKGAFNWIRNKMFQAKLEFTYKFLLYEGKYTEFFDQAALFGKMARKIQNAQVLAAFQAAGNFGAQTGGSTNAGTTVLGLIGLDAAELYFMTLKDLAGDSITFQPDSIVIPPALWATLKPIISPTSSVMQAYVTSTDKDTKLVPMENTYAGRFTNPIIERDMTSTTQWYVFGTSQKPVVYQRVLDLTVVPHPFNSLPMGNYNDMTLSWKAYIAFGAGVPTAHRRFMYRGYTS